MNLFQVVGRKLEDIETKEGRIMATVAEVKAQVDALQQSVTAESSVIDGAVSLLGTLSQMIKDAITSAATLQELKDSLTAVTNEVDTKKQALADAVVANTPAG